MGLHPFQFNFNFNFLGFLPRFSSISSFSLQFRVAFTSRGPENDLAIGWEFKNCEIWKFEGLVYHCKRWYIQSYLTEFGDLGHLTWLHSYVLLGVMHCDGDQVCLYSGFCWTIIEILVVAIAAKLMKNCAAFTMGNGDIVSFRSRDWLYMVPADGCALFLFMIMESWRSCYLDLLQMADCRWK